MDVVVAAVAGGVESGEAWEDGGLVVGGRRGVATGGDVVTGGGVLTVG